MWSELFSYCMVIGLFEEEKKNKRPITRFLFRFGFDFVLFWSDGTHGRTDDSTNLKVFPFSNSDLSFVKKSSVYFWQILDLLVYV